jgi:protocatechuate 3,4-dioxygenase beta subunit
VKPAFCILCSALALAPARAQPPVEKSTVQGQVINGVTRAPVKKAQVVLMKMEARGTSFGAVSDAEGNFAMNDLEPGRYRLSAFRAGFAPVNWQPGASGGMQALTLTPGQKLTGILLRLTPHAVVTGRVLDEEGQPLAKVSIQLLRLRYDRGQRRLMPAHRESTNDLGEYRVFDIAPGRYSISATYPLSAMYTGILDRTASPDGSGQPAQEEGYAPVYYPGTLDPASAGSVDLSPGAELRGVDFNLAPTRTVRVRGHLASEIPGTNVRETMLMLMPRGQSGSMFFERPAGGVIDDKGTFEFRGVVPGAYTLYARLFKDSRVYSAWQPVDVGPANVEGIAVAVTSGADLPGRVTVEGNPGSKLDKVMVSLEAGGAYFAGGAGARIKPDGTFTLENVAPGEYRLSVFGLEGGLHLKSARYGDREVLDAGLDLSKGFTGAFLDVAVAANGGQIEGTVADSQQKPAANVTVALVPDSSRRGKTYLFKGIATDPSGRFTLRGVAPGEYMLFAWEDVEQGAWQDPEFLKSYEKNGESISVQENGRHTVQLQLIPSGQQTGKDKSGNSK